jgi:hypothetical protein
MPLMAEKVCPTVTPQSAGWSNEEGERSADGEVGVLHGGGLYAWTAHNQRAVTGPPGGVGKPTRKTKALQQVAVGDGSVRMAKGDGGLTAGERKLGSGA